MKIKDKLQAATARAAGWLPDVLMVSGAVAVSVGTGMVYFPAGWIVAGLFSLAAGYMTARGAN